MDSWLWVVVGLLLLGVEVITPGGFVALFFGAAALAVGAAVGLGIGGSLLLQILLFSVLSIVSLLVFRGPLLARMHGKEPRRAAVDSLVGQIAVLAEDLGPNAVGKAELRGTAWTVRNVDAGTLSKGQRCRVERVDGLTLSIRGEQTIREDQQ